MKKEPQKDRGKSNNTTKENVEEWKYEEQDRPNKVNLLYCGINYSSYISIHITNLSLCSLHQAWVQVRPSTVY